MISFTQSFDCTQRKVVLDIASIIYGAMGYKIPDIADGDRLYYFERSKHPQEKAAWRAAEEIFELFYGDSPDYSDDDE